MRRSRKIRFKPAECPTFLNSGDCLTREQAIHRIRASLAQCISHPEAQHLIGLFSIAPEELAEAGLSYEILKVLERRALFI
jgi:hypothetical protein